MSSGPEEKAVQIKRLKEKYGENCRVIENIGDFANVVQVTLTPFDITVKFQVPDGYPNKPAEVIVTGRRTSEEFLTDLRQCLSQSNETHCLVGCVEKAVEWLTEHYRPSVATGAASEQKFSKKKTRKNKKTAPETDSPKKESMKTAEDVIKRILWDLNLEAESFMVGYLDRFTGLTEKNFSKFSWEDLASVDYTVLAIPKHRIQYFKYKSVIVWDKRNRMDNVFGSAGSGVTITDVIANYVEPSGEDNAVNDQAAAPDGSVETNTENRYGAKDDSSDDDDDDDDSDDGICVTLDKETPNDECSDEETEDNAPWQNKLRPNYFLCQRITASDIVNNVDSMQNQILDLDSRYLACCIQPSMLHVTLCTLGLHQPEHIAEVAEILRSNRDDLVEMARSGISLNISGVGNFFQRVVYGKVNHDKKFVDFVEHLRSLICESGINICDNYDFVPHMTILKVTRPVARHIGTKRVPSWMYEDFREVEFGTQAIDGIYLCAMKGEKVPGQFYNSPAQISLL